VQCRLRSDLAASRAAAVPARDRPMRRRRHLSLQIRAADSTENKRNGFNKTKETG